ncbi:MAG TPA: alpha/beta hydrolase-fold protein [Longimicrobiales bacterium]|nr:alpha/beta hydrolase-fold protein [Longimicrobiales bacterium]
MLGYDLSLPPTAGDGSTVLVLLHGRGSHRGDLQALRPRIPEAWALVTPQAPHPGHPWGYGPGWAWYRYEGEDRVEQGSLDWSLGLLHRFLAGLPATLGFRPGRTVLGGFSQGGTMSTAYALTRPGAVAGAMNLSGFLVESPAVRPEGDGALATPLFWGHGLRDSAVPHGLAVKGRARLRAAGARLTERDYDIGHWIDPTEIADAVAFVESLA